VKVSPNSFVSICFIFAGALIAVFLARRWFPSKRINPLVTLAKKLDFTLFEEHDYMLEHNLRDFFSLRSGKACLKLFYVLSCRRDGMRVKIFDYNGSALILGVGRFLYQTMGFVEADGANFQQFLIAPKTFYWRLRRMLSCEVFVEAGVPERFLRKFVLVVKKGEPVPKLKDVFFKRFLELNKPYSVETRGNRFIFYRRGVIIGTRHIEEFYKDLKAVAGAFT
jgi:hypothetical protein